MAIVCTRKIIHYHLHVADKQWVSLVPRHNTYYGSQVSEPGYDHTLRFIIHSELEISCVEINDGHVWKDLNIPSRILKTCAICGVKNVWSWITTIKCKECKMVCHRQCLPEFDEKICPLLVNHHDEDLSTTTNSNNKPSSVVLITGGLDGNDEVAEHDSNSSGCHAEKSASASKAPLCPLVDRPRSKSSSPSPKRESPFLFEV